MFGIKQWPKTIKVQTNQSSPLIHHLAQTLRMEKGMRMIMVMIVIVILATPPTHLCQKRLPALGTPKMINN